MVLVHNPKNRLYFVKTPKKPLIYALFPFFCKTVHRVIHKLWITAGENPWKTAPKTHSIHRVFHRATAGLFAFEQVRFMPFSTTLLGRKATITHFTEIA